MDQRAQFLLQKTQTPDMALRRFRSSKLMKKLLFAVAFASCTHAAYAAGCPEGTEVRVKGDIPGAISYDIFSALHPVTAVKLARFSAAQQVKLLPDNTPACVVADDGVKDPSAVLLKIPGGPMNYWVTDAQIRRAN